MIGRTLKVDLNTISDMEDGRAKVERGRFARVCIELDLQKKLVPRIICTSALFNVEYEGLSLICFSCGRYGHRKESCPWKKSPETSSSSTPFSESDPPPMSSSPPKPFPAEKDQFGPWMFVQKNGKVRIPKKEGQNVRFDGKRSYLRTEKHGHFRGSSSRYAALADADEGEDVIAETVLENEEARNFKNDGNKSLVVYEKKIEGLEKSETSKNFMSRVHKKGNTFEKIWAKGKGNLKPNNSGTKDANTILVIEQEKNGRKTIKETSAQGKKISGQRTHEVVQGNMNGEKKNLVESPKKIVVDQGRSIEGVEAENSAKSSTLASDFPTPPSDHIMLIETSHELPSEGMHEVECHLGTIASHAPGQESKPPDQ